MQRKTSFSRQFHKARGNDAFPISLTPQEIELSVLLSVQFVQAVFGRERYRKSAWWHCMNMTF
jgi:hypothetical protein